MTRLRRAIETATATLGAAGIDSARYDAEELAAHVAGTERGRLPLLDAPSDDFFDRYHEAIAARAGRVPLQHLLGTVAFGPVTLHIGPGVFIPRPETETVLEWAMAQPVGEAPVIVDVCTGSGALAAALSRHWPAARVVGIDDSETALGYARRNCGRAELICADVTCSRLLPELDGKADLVVANPPYLPDGTVLGPEVARHDPGHALFGGPDGMAVVVAAAAAAGRWLRPGGRFAVEHDDTRACLTVERVDATGLFDEVTVRRDLAGRARFVTASRNETTN